MTGERANVADALAAVEKAARELERAKETTDQARQALLDAMARAYDEGASLSKIAEAAEVSRQYVARLLGTSSGM